MAREDFYGVRNGYAYFVYLPSGWTSIKDAIGAARVEVINGSIGDTFYLDTDEWVFDRDVYGDVTKMNGSTGVRHVTEDELRTLIKEKSISGVDPEKVLTSSR